MKNLSENKLNAYRRIRNYVCENIVQSEKSYNNYIAREKFLNHQEYKDRKKYLEEIALYKDILFVLTKYKEMITEAD